MTQSTLLIAIYLLCTPLIFAQGFVDAYPYPQLGDGARVITKTGEETKGKWFGMTGTPKNLKNIQIKDETKTRIKYLTPDVDRVYITLSGLAKFSKLMDASTATTTRGFIFKKEEVNKIGSIVNMSQNWDEVMNSNNEVIFDFLSEKDGKYGMRQLLNPGFDSKYRAYTWGQAVQAMGKSYPEMMLISPSGEKILTKVKTYQENFTKLFGDCPEFMKLFDTANVDMDDLAFHLFLYTDMCK